MIFVIWIWFFCDAKKFLFILCQQKLPIIETRQIMELLAAKSKSLSLNFENDIISLYTNRFIPNNAGGSHTGSFNPPSSFPLYYDGKWAGTGFRYQEIHFFQPDNGSL